MEILLLKDIKGVGKKNDLLIVGDGFALNYLLPKRIALVATPTVRKRYGEEIRRRAEEKERERELRTKALSAVLGKSVTFTKKATKTGKLYAGITAEHIAGAVKAQIGLEVPPEALALPDPIKAIGTFAVPINLGESAVTLTVVVAEEKG